MDHAIRPAKEFGMRIDGEPIKQRLQFGPKAAALSGVALELEIAILQSRWAVIRMVEGKRLQVNSVGAKGHQRELAYLLSIL